jgi:hypothetical protein
MGSLLMLFAFLLLVLNVELFDPPKSQESLVRTNSAPFEILRRVALWIA